MSRLPHSREAWAWLTTRVFVAAAALVALAALIIGSITLAEVRQQQTHSAGQLDDTHRAAVAAERLLKIVLDCQSPEGRCHAANAAATEQILHAAGRLFVYAELCGRNLETAGSLKALEQCIDGLVATHGLD